MFKSPRAFNFFFLATVMATVIASPAAEVNDLVTKDNCNDHLGRCDQNGCAGVFANPTALHGTCTAGTYNGCLCNKCGDTNGSCNDNGCVGVSSVCTEGEFQGCPCNE
ncbi:hypothetical protein B0H11DRAFT_1937034 [Mycena galericulata]|nr:hypothetical protein B0H11DRAFT_1937034 [Mycena galericulata]